jgi:hypothetical protein
METIVDLIDQNKVLCLKILGIPLLAYLVSTPLKILPLLLISLINHSIIMGNMVEIVSRMETIMGIDPNLADHAIVVAAKYANRRDTQPPIAIIVTHGLIPPILIIYLLSLLVFMFLN